MTTIVTRAGKGLPLTHSEMDANFNNLNNDKVEVATFNNELAKKANLAGATFTGPVSNTDLSLQGLDSSLHSGTIVDAFIYDTSKDSDGGAWRMRCLDKSWYNETIYGKWLGQAANETAARAVLGATTNDYYQNTTDGKFYALNATSGQTEVFRGNTRGFPAVAGIVAESARVVIYDLSQASCPMWMVFSYAAGGYTTGNVLFNSAGLSSVTGINAKIFVADSNSADGRVLTIDTLLDRVYTQQSDAAYCGIYNGVIKDRNAGKGYNLGIGNAIVNKVVNDIAATVLPDAPVDPISGMPIPTVAIATNGGVSVIKHDGTVVNITGQLASVAKAVFNKRNEIISQYDYANEPAIYAIPNTNTTKSSFLRRYYPLSSAGQDPANPKLLGDGNGNILPAFGNSDTVALGSTNRGISLLRENPTTSSNGMVSYITNAYNSGWQVGDSRLATLADTAAETITASGELVTNGTFDADLTGWTINLGGGTGSVVWDASGAANITGDGTNITRMAQSFATVTGETYSVACSVATNDVNISFGTTEGGTDVAAATTFAVGTRLVNFTAKGTTTWINFTKSGANSSLVDNVSIKLAEPDRSVKNRGVIVNGSLSKSAVASGAELVAYSGFSTANYLEAPYSADLDFGTGDFCVMGWVKVAAIPATAEALFYRGDDAEANPRLLIEIASVTGNIAVYPNAAVAYGSSIQSSVGISTGIWSFVAVIRTGSKVYVYVNTTSSSGAANTVDLTNTSALARVGYRSSGTPHPFSGSIALWRISATAPSADQIAHIYATEKKLFEPNAQCTIDGTTPSVSALAYDEDEDALHVGTSWGRSKFKDLVRIESAATAVGSISALSANGGAHLSAGTSGRYVQPAISFRDELKRKYEAQRAAMLNPVNLDFDAAAGQTAFVLPKGFSTHSVYVAGAEKRIGSTNDYTVAFDGFAETVNFAVAPGTGVWVRVKAVRSN